MSAALHRDFIDIAIGNALTEPGRATMLGTPVDLSTVTVDSYVTAGIADHLCPWQACYRSTQLLGGESRFILSTSGHIASLVNPPGNPKSTFQVAQDTPTDPGQWLERAETVQGSWWPDFMTWVSERSGDEVAPPSAEKLEELAAAPAPMSSTSSPEPPAPGRADVVRTVTVGAGRCGCRCATGRTPASRPCCS
ncbi:hypothetical protein [Blastococcus brunescens]|uniref:Uncharacterized protein n=1 Tax=Blastococcus brunescens TaxID=1564165 RepID=A0ABZ1AXH6_9ACTN|nr:hypothetical protein [Blastococcus sp. BMG 8361]WRL63262.1 hypothetical protein U6N30_26415 [Blastococcus sp. BMG 8361]